jgi:hypothetical protein
MKGKINIQLIADIFRIRERHMQELHLDISPIFI